MDFAEIPRLLASAQSQSFCHPLTQLRLAETLTAVAQLALIGIILVAMIVAPETPQKRSSADRFGPEMQVLRLLRFTPLTTAAA